tara:strand:+ start:2298 stop:3059 length:762 start_codon:yes stop_codon:yes gene_type:complete
MFEDGTVLNELLVERLNYFIYVVLLLIGLHAMIAKKNLIKKLIGMSIFQTAIILFYVSISVKDDATIPIYKPEHDPHGEHTHAQNLEVNSSDAELGVGHGPVALQSAETAQYANPLPHVLMLTAIVVGVATLGLALALCQRIYQGYGTIEEDELLTKIERADARTSLSPLAKAKKVRKLSNRSSRKPVAKEVAKEKTKEGAPKRATMGSKQKSSAPKRKVAANSKQVKPRKPVAQKKTGKNTGGSFKPKKGSA